MMLSCCNSKFSSSSFPSQGVIPAVREAYSNETKKKCDIVVDEENFLPSDRYTLASFVSSPSITEVSFSAVLVIDHFWVISNSFNDKGSFNFSIIFNH